MLRLALAIVVVSLPCASAQTKPARQKPSLAEMPRLAVGERLPLDRSVLFVPKGYVAPKSGRVPLFIHFQGGVRMAHGPSVDPVAPWQGAAFKLSRGGSFTTHSSNARSATRSAGPTTSADPSTGVRPARVVR